MPRLASLSLLFGPLCLCLACRAGAPEPQPGSEAAPAEAQDPATAKPASEQGPRIPAPTAPDPELAAKLADLDTLCKAVDHDYKDGTLGDYYAGLSMKTSWGQAQLAAGNESVQPGRLLEKAVEELSPGAADPALGSCRTLLDYLDDVE